MFVFRYSDEETLEECDDSEYYVETVSPNRDTPDSLSSQTKTGLAQSNTSLSHQSYCYTNQQGYENGCYGYSYCTGYEQDSISRQPVDKSLPKITAAIYKCSLKRSPSSEDLCLAAAGTASPGDQRVPNLVKTLDGKLLQEQIPEETSNDISSAKFAENEATGSNSEINKTAEGDIRVQSDSVKRDIGMDEIKIQNEIVQCK